jgi:DNA polymerase III psi subunit
MSEPLLWRARSLMRLRDMLRRLILEEHATRCVDPEKAAHLAEAVADLRTLVARLETESCLHIFSAPRQYPRRATLRLDSGEQPFAHTPRGWKAITHTVANRA